MHISKVKIENFRNLENVTVKTGKNLLLVGANGTGKSNFIHALRLVLDSSLSRRDRRLSADDFWRGENESSWGGRVIRVIIEISDYQNNQNLRSYLDDYCVDELGTATITYEFRPRGNVSPETSLEADYEPKIYGGNDESIEIPGQFFDHLNLRVIDALRDAERELNARRMPLKALLELYGIDGDALQDIVEYIEAANERIKDIPSIQTLEADIRNRLLDLQEHINQLDPVLRLGANNADDIVRALRILLEKELLLPLSSTSLGLANLLFLTLSLLEVEKRETITRPIVENVYEFIILAIEEPEAHLHPHVQRVLFRDFLKRSPLILTTHSPHIASVAPIDSILMFRQQGANQSSTINSTAGLAQILSLNEMSDLSRYLDITRAEMLFARGVILVEGDTEEFTISAFARLMGINLDKFGITVCNVRGTDFKPYVKFLGADGLDIPFIVLTDGDKYANLKARAIPYARNENLITNDEVQELKNLSSIELHAELERRNIPYYDGLKRCIALLEEMLVDKDHREKINRLYESRQWQNMMNELRSAGIFINEWSFEPSVLQSGYAELILNVLEECGVGSRVLEQLQQEKYTVHTNDKQIKYWMMQIDNLGKGRVGQRLSTKLFALEVEGNNGIPEYIRLGLNHLLGLLNFTDTENDFEEQIEQQDDEHEDALPF